MKILRNLLLAFLGTSILACGEQKKDTQENTTYTSFDQYPVYEGADLGLSYSPEKSVFKIWSPTAQEVKLKFYADGTGGQATQEIALEKGENGVWKTEVAGDQKNKFYTFQVKIDGKFLDETTGIYAKAVGVNGKRAAVIDLKETNPQGWENDKKPELKSFTDMIIYEMHIRDLSIHASSGSEHKGKFLGIAKTGTKSPDGLATTLDHFKELGVTHLHLLPVYDYGSVDESKLDVPQFNWGYDPQNYNVPEGSYSSNPADPKVRIKEFKEMVKALHENGIRVIMDVVYNHTFVGDGSPFSLEVPQYYYRQNQDGSYSNASGCGNETASDRAMFQKYMIESVKYWATEYHIDGFRFDLMAIHDIETMNKITDELDKIDKTIYVYGEGWTAGDSPLPTEKRALKKLTYKLNRTAAFSDDMRDGIKGHWSNEKEKGFVSGKDSLEESVKFGIVASTFHPQINYKNINNSDSAWAKEPSQCINYVSCHDNHTLYDKLKVSNEGASEAEILQMHRLANTIVLTSQGVAFLHAGVDMARTKQGQHNSFNLPDSINQIDWSRKKQYKAQFDYYKNLVALRKAHPAFRMPSNELIQKHLQFFDVETPQLIAYQISGNANGDSWKNVIVIFNGSKKSQKMEIPAGNWKVVLEKDQIKESGIRNLKGGSVEISGVSALILAE